MTEEQIQSFKAASALLTLIRQKHFLRPGLDPHDLWVRAHVFLVRLDESERLSTLGTREASVPLSVESLVMPQLLPARKRFTTAGAGVGLTSAVREHVGSEPAHVSEQSPAARAKVSPGVRPVIELVQRRHKVGERVRRRDRFMERPLGDGVVFPALNRGKLLGFSGGGRGSWFLCCGTSQRRHCVFDQRHLLPLLRRRA